jgi:heme a synthase
MLPPEPRPRVLRRLAWLCAVLVFAITSLSAFIRLSKTGVGCDPWPQCYAQAAQSAQQGQPPEAGADSAITPARTIHRVVAVIPLIVILMLVTASLARPVLWPELRMASALFALALFLAVLGRWTAGSRMPAITLGNLLGGFAMFAVSVRLVLKATATATATSAAAPRAGPGLSLLAWCAAALVFVDVALGGLVPAAPADSFDQLALTMHWVGAAAVFAVSLPVGILAWRGGQRRAGAALLVLLAVQAVLGAVLSFSSVRLGVVLVHNVAASLLLGALMVLAARR